MKKSFWLEFSKKQDYPKLKENIKTDILIIGGGITGILCAYELSNYYKDITIVEQNELYHTTTGYTTGKITYQHGYCYANLIKDKGMARAKDYYEANKMAFDYLVNQIKEHNIDCDLDITDAVLYAKTEAEYYDLLKERRAYEALGIDHNWGENQILPFKTYAYLKVPGQASFNVVKYLDHILGRLSDVKIYENTKVTETVDNDQEVYAITTDNYKIEAKYIINASHYPFYKGFNFYFLKVYPTIAYVAVGKVPHEELVPNGLYINSQNPIYSIRYAVRDNEKYLMLAGQSRDANQIDDFKKELSALKTFGKEELSIDEYIYEWYNQDYDSTDMIPIIGRVKSSHSYIATAFKKWGMTTSVLASIMIRDLITKKVNKYEKLFNPNRSFLTFKTIKYNLKMGKTFFKTKLLKAIIDNNVKKGEGSIVKIINRKYGVYIDQDGKTYVVKPICPHMKCTLLFNNVSKTYDCPCHGSRFRYDGKCLDGPAPRDLELLDIDLKIQPLS